MSYGGYEYNNPGFGFDPMSMGGGFGGMDMNNTGFGDDATNAVAATPKNTEKKGSRDRQSLLPMTVKQLHSIAEEDGVNKLDGVEVFSARIVGTIESIEAHATNVVYRITDGTGMVECKSFVDKDGLSAAKFADCRERCLVEVNGNVRTYEGHKSIMIYHMSVVDDWNRLTHHFLESIYTHLKNTRGPLSTAESGTNNVQNAMQYKQNMNTSVNSVFNAPSEGNPVLAQREKIMKAYGDLSEGNSMGTTFQEVMLYLTQGGTNLTMQQLRHEVECLTEDGRLFTTVDENHHRPTTF